MDHIWRSSAMIASIFLVAGCNRSEPVVAQLPPPPVTIAQPVVREVTEYDDFEGRIEAIEKVEVRARVHGYLTKVLFENGQRVKKGDLLFEIDPRPYEATLEAAKASKAAAQASLELAQAEYDRTEQLAANQAASRSELDQWAAKQGVAKAELMRADADIEQAKLDIEFTKITAPVDGRVSRTNVTVGNLVTGTGDTVLTTIVSVDPMYVRFEIDERRLLKYLGEASKNGKRSSDATSRETLREAKVPIFVGLDGEKG